MFGAAKKKTPTIVFIILTIIALGLVAATITSVAGVETGQRELNIDSRNSPESNIGSNITVNDSTGSGNLTQDRQSIDLSICVTFLTKTSSILAIIGGVVIILLGIYRRFNAATALLAGTGLIPIVWLLYFFSTNCFAGGTGKGGSLLSGASIMSNEGALDSVPLPPSVVAGVFGIIIVAAIVVLLTQTGEDETYEPIEEDQEEPELSEFARAAGKAADRIEMAHVSVDNAVYQAWLDMIDILDVSKPATASPRDFAEMAIATGLERNDVLELTRLFNEVRYGGKSPEEREEDALQVLRRIERTYTPSGGGG